jgi:hypothetical protein
MKENKHMNGFTSDDMICISIVIIIIAVYIIVGFFASRKLIGGELPAGNIPELLGKIDYQMRMRGWDSKMYPDKEKITISKDFLIGTSLYLRRRPDNMIEILHTPYTGPIGWILFAAVFLFMFFCGILGVFAIIGAIVLHVMSRNFATQEVIPMIVHGYHSPPPLYPMPAVSYPPPVMQPSYVCPTCGRPGRYFSAYQRWYCNYCGRYY